MFPFWMEAASPALPVWFYKLRDDSCEDCTALPGTAVLGLRDHNVPEVQRPPIDAFGWRRYPAIDLAWFIDRLHERSDIGLIVRSGQPFMLPLNPIRLVCRVSASIEERIAIESDSAIETPTG